MNMKYEKTLLRFEIFHTIESVIDYINKRDDIAELIAADYALVACEESGYNDYSEDNAGAYFDYLEDNGAKFNRENALNLFKQGVKFLELE